MWITGHWVSQGKLSSSSHIPEDVTLCVSAWETLSPDLLQTSIALCLVEWAAAEGHCAEVPRPGRQRTQLRTMLTPACLLRKGQLLLSYNHASTGEYVSELKKPKSQMKSHEFLYVGNYLQFFLRQQKDYKRNIDVYG